MDGSSAVIRGGGTVGPSRWFTFHASWPLASLSVNQAGITLKLALFRSYEFRREDILALVEDRFWLFPQLRIVHKKDGYPPLFLFAVTRFSRLRRTLEENGYALGPPPAANPGTRYQNWPDFAAEMFGCWPMRLSLCAAAAGLLAAVLILKRFPPGSP